MIGLKYLVYRQLRTNGKMYVDNRGRQPVLYLERIAAPGSIIPTGRSFYEGYRLTHVDLRLLEMRIGRVFKGNERWHLYSKYPWKSKRQNPYQSQPASNAWLAFVAL